MRNFDISEEQLKESVLEEKIGLGNSINPIIKKYLPEELKNFYMNSDEIQLFCIQYYYEYNHINQNPYLAYLKIIKDGVKLNKLLDKLKEDKLILKIYDIFEWDIYDYIIKNEKTFFTIDDIAQLIGNKNLMIIGLKSFSPFGCFLDYWPQADNENTKILIKLAKKLLEPENKLQVIPLKIEDVFPELAKEIEKKEKMKAHCSSQVLKIAANCGLFSRSSGVNLIRFFSDNECEYFTRRYPVPCNYDTRTEPYGLIGSMSQINKKQEQFLITIRNLEDFKLESYIEASEKEQKIFEINKRFFKKEMDLYNEKIKKLNLLAAEYPEDNIEINVPNPLPPIAPKGELFYKPSEELVQAAKDFITIFEEKNL